MGCHSRQRPSETETVREEDIGTLHTEFIPIIVLTIKNVTGKRLYRRDIWIIGIPCASGDMPSAFIYILLYL